MAKSPCPARDLASRSNSGIWRLWLVAVYVKRNGPCGKRHGQCFMSSLCEPAVPSAPACSQPRSVPGRTSPAAPDAVQTSRTLLGLPCIVDCARRLFDHQVALVV